MCIRDRDRSYGQPVNTLSPQGMSLPQGIMAIFGFIKPLLPENGHAIVQSAFQAVANFAQNSFGSSQSHFQVSQSQASQQSSGGTFWDLPRAQNPVNSFFRKLGAMIADLLF